MDKVEDDKWPQALEKYLKDLELDHLNISRDREFIIEQLLAHAVRLEYSDNSKNKIINLFKLV